MPRAPRSRAAGGRWDKIHASTAAHQPSSRGKLCRAVSSVEVLEEMKDSPASESFIRPHLRKLAAYTPIEPFEVLSKRLGRDALDIVKLDANENPCGPPPEVLEALGSMPLPNIYQILRPEGYELPWQRPTTSLQSIFWTFFAPS